MRNILLADLFLWCSICSFIFMSMKGTIMTSYGLIPATLIILCIALGCKGVINVVKEK